MSNNLVILISSDSEEDILIEENGNTKTNEQQKDKLNYSQKRKLSLNLPKENSMKKHKLLENKMVFINTKVSNEIFPCKLINDTSNAQSNSINCLRKDSENNNSNGKKLSETPADLDQNKNISIKKNETIKQINSKFLAQPGSSKQANLTKKFITPQLVVKNKIPISHIDSDTFDIFIKTCLIKKSDNTTKKILQKLQKRYNNCNPVNINSEEFNVFLKAITKKILNNEEEKFYTYIQEVNDEIKLYINESKIANASKMNVNVVNNNFNEMDTNEEITLQEEKLLSKDDMEKVKKLEKAIKKCQNKIKELETQEINFDDEEDSAYIQEDRYKRKLIELCALLSRIVGDNTIKREIYKKKIKRKDIRTEMTGITLVDEAIIDFVNIRIQKVNKLKHIKNHTAIADYLPVPDYEDIFQCISKCNDQNKLRLDKTKIDELTRNAFQSIGKYLKKQRILDIKKCMLSYVENTEDPALKNDVLNKVLQQNKIEGDKKLEEMFKKYEKKEEESLIRNQKQQILESPASDKQNNNETEKSKNDNEENERKKIDIIDKDNKSEEQQTNLGKKNVSESEKKNDLVKKIRLCKENEKDSDETNKLLENKEDDLHEESRLLQEKQKSNFDKKDEEHSCEFNVNTKVTYAYEKSNKQNKEEKNNIDKNIIIENICSLNNNLDKKISSNSVSNNNNVTNPNNEDALRIVSEICGITTKSNNNNKDSLLINHEEIEILSDEDETTLKNNLNKSEKENKTQNDDGCNRENTVKRNTNINKIVNININVSEKETVLQKQEIKDSISCNSDQSNKNNTIKLLRQISNVKNVLKSKNVDVQNSCSITQTEKNKVSTSRTEIISSTIDITEKTVTPTEKHDEIVEMMDVIEEIEISTSKEITNNLQDSNIACNDAKFDSKNDSVPQEVSPFIKVCSFAKPPDSWKDVSSPKKSKQNIVKLPVEQVFCEKPKPDYVDLTAEKDNRPPSTSTRIINPLAINTRRGPVQNVFVVKNVINNYRVPLSRSDIINGKVVARNVRVLNTQTGETVAFVPKMSNVVVNHIPAQSLNQNSSTLSTNIITRPYTSVTLHKKNN